MNEGVDKSIILLTWTTVDKSWVWGELGMTSAWPWDQLEGRELQFIPQLSLWYRRALVPGHLQIPKSMDAQVPYIEWPSTVCVWYLWMQNPWILRADCTNFSLLSYPWEERYHRILVLLPEIIRPSGYEWLKGWKIASTVMHVQSPPWELKTFIER